ncbi:hypothetical protein MHU86_9256 [Fragilaria crotonensis]|nr:hypothetical protein MHU86_9256 [Fragilaria crotonensis]
MRSRDLCTAILTSLLLAPTCVPIVGLHVGSPSKRIGVARWIVENEVKTATTEVYSGTSRRKLIVLSILPALAISQPCNAGLFSGTERRDLSFCLVNLLRVQYWAEAESRDIQINLENDDRVLDLYLESRLGAKAAVTGKVGGGATSRVYTLASLKFRETLEDLAWYARKAKNKRADELITDLVEALASLVEFDGLETTLDPSPRSSLMRSMYDRKKLEFLRRMLSERIIPTAQALFNEFDRDVRDICLNYVAVNYPNELPIKIVPPSETGVAE